MNRIAPILAAAILMVGPAAASEKKEEGKGAPVLYVDLGTIALPVIVDGRVANYVFVKARINLTPAADMAKVRDMGPFIRDAVVRAAHRKPLALAKDYQKLDEPGLKALLTREAATATPRGSIKSVDVNSQTPLRFLRRPAA